MGAVRDENFIVEHGWMINRLGLKGNELRIYAIIYGFSQTEGTWFTGGLQYLADWVRGTKQGVIGNLKALVEKGLIEKQETIVNGVKLCSYRTTDLNSIQQSLTGCSTKFNGGIQQSLTPPVKQSLPNNIPIKDIPKDSEKDIGGQAPTAPTKVKRFVPPTVEEVAAYCRERENHVDAQRWFDYYTANGWKVGRNPMKDWKACVRTWERQGAQGGGRVQQPPERSRIKTEADYAAGMEGWG